jgi:hypothetical protein
MRDYYADLQVAPQADAGVITAAYRYLARQCHPDVAGAAGVRKMQALNEAYEVLSDPMRRRRYDADRFAADRLAITPLPAWPIQGGTASRVPQTRQLSAAWYVAVMALCLVVGTIFWVTARPGQDRPALAARAGRTPTAALAAGQRLRSGSTPRPTGDPHALSSPLPEVAIRAETGSFLDGLLPALTSGGGEPVQTAAPAPPADAPPPQLPQGATAVPLEATPQPQFQAATIAAPAPTPAPAYARHIVEQGDNLLRISERYGVPQGVIMQLNGLTDANRIRVGDELLIPVR